MYNLDLKNLIKIWSKSEVIFPLGCWGWVRIIIGYVLICFWSWCCSLNSKAWVSVCGSSRVTNGISLPFPFMTFIERFFPPSLSSYWIHFSAALALDFLAMAAQHSDILHQLFTVTDDVNQFPEWFAVRKVFFCAKMHTILFAMITISFCHKSFSY